MAKVKVPLPHFEGVDQQKGEQRAEVRPVAQVDASGVRARVQIDEAPAQASEPAEAAAATTATEEAQAPAQPSGGSGWLSKLAPGHEHAALGGLCGLVVALLVFVVGFWQTLFVSLLVAVGVTLGQYLDGDPKIVNLLRRLLSEGHGSNE